jgi:hypothetical protein
MTNLSKTSEKTYHWDGFAFCKAFAQTVGAYVAASSGEIDLGKRSPVATMTNAIGWLMGETFDPGVQKVANPSQWNGTVYMFDPSGENIGQEKFDDFKYF